MKMNEVVIHTNSDRSSKCNVGLKEKVVERYVQEAMILKMF